jgi:iron(II)-dependent oxidoreductase
MELTTTRHDKSSIASHLERARHRSLGLLAPLSEDAQTRQHSPLMSPLIWDLAHVANYEELWLLRSVAGISLAPHLDEVYNPFENPRAIRSTLPFLGPAEARRYAADVRGHALDVLDGVELDPTHRLLADGFVYGMVIQHEHQHDETMLAALQLMPLPYPPALAAPPPAPVGAGPTAAAGSDEVFVAGGEFLMGTDLDAWAYDNERPAHPVVVEPFFIDRAPVTNAQYAEFIAAGGYTDERWWTGAGWAWCQKASPAHPQFWQHDGDGWLRTRFGLLEAVPADEPVQHVCWYEADAYARWAGKRLPTEAEWEKAAAWDATSGRKYRYPWGDDAPDVSRANLGQRQYQPGPVDTLPDGASPNGCRQMLGSVWEWTASDFLPYPGFASFPYREYSEVFYGDEYKVLRGGSWATHPDAIRTTFRNWDFPIRRQIFAGFRCARAA